jgi:hypothetical protein
MRSGRSSDQNVIIGLLSQPAYGVGRHAFENRRREEVEIGPVTATGLDPPALEDVALKKSI